MKTIILLSILIVSLGCAAKNIAPEPTRIPSSGANSPLPLPRKTYQGPFFINPENAQRPEAKIYLPEDYESKQKWPLVVLLHGFSGTAEAEDSYLTMRYRVSRRGFILLTPDGTLTPKGVIGEDGKDLVGNPFWHATDFCCDFGRTGVDDVGYLTKLIERVKQKYNVDSTRVYLFGHSNGGFMANRLACETGETFAAVASLAGGSYKDVANCRKPKALPYLQIHAIDDPTISYKDDPRYAGGQETLNQWLSRNRCSRQAQSQAQKDYVFLLPGKDTAEKLWRCPEGKDVAMWTIRPYSLKGHNPHVPLFHLNFSDAVLDFLFRYSAPTAL